MVNPDDVCGICDTKRDEHGDRNHVFSREGMLIPLERGPEGRTPPQHRDEVPAQPSPQPNPNDLPNVGKAFATLVEILAEKQIVNGPEIVRIFRGEG